MKFRPLATTIFCALVIGVSGSRAMAQDAPAGDEPAGALRLFAVEIKVGPNWDGSKAPNEQAFFSEHSANLKRLRDEGHIVMGARYSDIGLIVISAASPEEVTAMMEEDPSVSAGTFVFEVHSFNVFYPGLVENRSRR